MAAKEGLSPSFLVGALGLRHILQALARAPLSTARSAGLSHPAARLDCFGADAASVFTSKRLEFGRLSHNSIVIVIAFMAGIYRSVHANNAGFLHN
jgi:hypothetical protein